MNGHLISLSLAATTYSSSVSSSSPVSRGATSVKTICIIEAPLMGEALFRKFSKHLEALYYSKVTGTDRSTASRAGDHGLEYRYYDRAAARVTPRRGARHHFRPKCSRM